MAAALAPLACALAAALALATGSPVGRQVPCEPGELVFVECNLCTCGPRGAPNAVCARMWCQPPPRNNMLTPDVADDAATDD